MARNRPRLWAIVAISLGVVLVAISVLGLVFAPRRTPGIYMSDAGATRPTAAAIATPGAHRSPTTTLPPSAQPRGSTPAAHPRAKKPAPSRQAHAAPVDPNLAPLAVRIPTLGVSSQLIPLGLNPDNTLQVPADFSVAGWYVYRPVPGQPGPAIIAGHVDSRSGPGVFYRLRDVALGATIEVTRNDGSVAQFAVTAKEEHPKAAFPTAHVYGPTPSAELRLITCGGTFNSSSGHYNDNIIVFAKLLKIVK